MKRMTKEQDQKEQINFKKLSTRTMRIAFWVCQSFIFCTMIASIVQLAVADDALIRSTQVSHIMLCVVAHLLCLLPIFIQRKLKLYVPPVLHIFIIIFIFAHFILGEVVGVYKTSAVFDKILHTTSGVVIASCGFSLVNLLNKTPNQHLKLNPFFVAFFAFCFALAIALLWEIYEYASDCITGSNMQRYIPPKGVEQEVPPVQGYGLVDTMGDVIVSTISAFVVCVIGYFSLKYNKAFINRVLLRKVNDYETAIAAAEEAGDVKLAERLKKAQTSTAGVEEKENPQEQQEMQPEEQLEEQPESDV